MPGCNLVRFLRDERGATAIEYGMLAAMIAIALIGSFVVFGGALNNLFGTNGVGRAGAVLNSRANSIQ